MDARLQIWSASQTDFYDVLLAVSTQLVVVLVKMPEFMYF